MLWCLPNTARAGNDDSVLIGDDAALTGGAVTATVRTGASLWYNPAGLARVDRDTVDVSGTAYSLRLYRVPTFLRLFNGAAADADINEVVVIPTAITYVRPFRRASVALGIFVPDRLDVTLRSQIEAPTAAGTTVEWLLNLKTESDRYHFVVGGGWSLHERFTLGFSAHIVYASEASSAQFAGGLNDGTVLSNSNTFITASTQVSTSGLGFAGSFGVQWHPTDNFSIGASVLSPITLFYSSVSESTVLAGANIPIQGSFNTSNTKESDFGFEAALPARTRLGFAYRHPRFTISLDSDIQHRLRNPDLDVDRRAVWNIRAGAIVHATSSIDVGAGFFTDRNPERGVDEFTDFDIEFYGFSLGFSYLSERKLDPTEEKKDKLTFGTTIAFRYALGKGDVGGLLLTDTFADPNATFVTFRTPIKVHELAIYLGTKFLF